MKRSLLVPIVLLACGGTTASAPSSPAADPTPSPWCDSGGSYADAKMPKLEPYSGALPEGPTTEDFVVLLYHSPETDNQLWAIYVDGGEVRAAHTFGDGDYAALQGKLINSSWGKHGIPMIGVNPPPPPPEGTDWKAAYYLESARLVIALPALAAERAAAVE